MGGKRCNVKGGVPVASAAAPKYMSCNEGGLAPAAMALSGSHNSAMCFTFWPSSVTSLSEDALSLRIATVSCSRDMRWHTTDTEANVV